MEQWERFQECRRKAGEQDLAARDERFKAYLVAVELSDAEKEQFDKLQQPLHDFAMREMAIM